LPTVAQAGDFLRRGFGLGENRKQNRRENRDDRYDDEELYERECFLKQGKPPNGCGFEVRKSVTDEAIRSTGRVRRTEDALADLPWIARSVWKIFSGKLKPNRNLHREWFRRKVELHLL
jgi:hypothetical protein